MQSEEISIEVVEPQESGQAVLERALGDFRLVRKIGQGAMGEVHLAEHRVIGSRVAVKFLRPAKAGHAHLVEQFFEEARAANRVGHPGIVKVYDLKAVPPDLYFLVMEYLEGRPLSRLLGAPVALRTAVPLLAQTCDALEAVHRAGLVHQDIKPDNIFLVPRGRTELPRLLDFGAARLRAVPGAAGPEGRMVVGTPAYMPPEQWQGQTADPRTDLYALGIVAYQLVTGRHPFMQPGKSLKEIFVSHRDAVPPDPREGNPAVSDAMAEVVLRALHKRPEDRFCSAEQMARALRRVLSGPPRKRRHRARPVESATQAITLQLTAAPTPAPGTATEAEPAPGTEGPLSLEGQLWLNSFRAFSTASAPGPAFSFQAESCSTTR
jgi:serine/threonine protein kinase